MIDSVESVFEDLPAKARTESGRTSCFHCGETCFGGEHKQDEKLFCCQGCLLVYDLLSENELGHFYDLRPHPGVRNRRSKTEWSYLDEPELERRLVDFRDEKLTRITLQIPAIHCIACVWLLENLFQLNPAIGRCVVNFPRREVAISFATGKSRLSELVALLASIGYEPQLNLGELERPKNTSGRKRQWLQVGIAAFAFGNIMLLSLPLYLGLDSLSGPGFKVLGGWLSVALALPAILYSASDYWKSALVSIRQRFMTLDIPIALGLLAIYGQSFFEVSTGKGPGYCDSLTGLILFLLCGRLFQKATYDRLIFDRDYRCFFPLSVVRKTAGSEQTIAISNVRQGDRLVVRNGELIPADSKLVSGNALVDYSFVTGESVPVEKNEDDYLFAGGQQIGAAIEIETLKPVSQGYLTSLWNDEAFKKKCEDLNTLTNRYSGRFTWTVLAVAIGAGLLWFFSGNSARAVKAFVSVLIVACPCALALAAPFALGTAQRLLAKMQVFLKNSLVIERMAKVQTIVFDKTGTLTARTSAISFSGPTLTIQEKKLIRSLSRHSTHPHAISIGSSMGDNAAAEPVIEFVETPGLGIKGEVSGHQLLLGSRAWLARHQVSISDLDLPPGSTSYVSIDGICRGAFVLTNDFRENIRKLPARLATRYEIALLSGDNDKERNRLEELFGNGARLLFDQTPFDKLSFIRNLQNSGKTVMMVGDGLNDAGALKQSDVGVAVVENVSAFSPASDVIIEAGQVPRLSNIMCFARTTARIVQLSFGISAAYNIIGISIAAAGLLEPLVCAILMPLSSVSVVLFACGATKWAETMSRCRVSKSIQP